MSTILKALKKSETERRLGEAPRLGLIHAATDASRRTTPYQGWIAAILGCIAFGLVIYLLWPNDTVRESPPERRAAQSISQATLPESQAPETTPGAPAGTAAQNLPDTTTAAPVESEPTPATTAEPDSTDRASVVREAVQPAPVTSQTPQPIAEEPAPESAPAEEELPEYALLTRYRHLPRERREALPPLTLNVLIYADDPARRFVMINLNRYAEGDAISEGLKIIEIIPTGVVIEGKDGRFLLPRP